MILILLFFVFPVYGAEYTDICDLLQKVAAAWTNHSDSNSKPKPFAPRSDRVAAQSAFDRCESDSSIGMRDPRPYFEPKPCTSTQASYLLNAPPLSFDMPKSPPSKKRKIAPVTQSELFDDGYSSFLEDTSQTQTCKRSKRGKSRREEDTDFAKKTLKILRDKYTDSLILKIRDEMSDFENMHDFKDLVMSIRCLLQRGLRDNYCGVVDHPDTLHLSTFCSDFEELCSVFQSREQEEDGLILMMGNQEIRVWPEWDKQKTSAGVVFRKKKKTSPQWYVGPLRDYCYQASRHLCSSLKAFCNNESDEAVKQYENWLWMKNFWNTHKSTEQYKSWLSVKNFCGKCVVEAMKEKPESRFFVKMFSECKCAECKHKEDVKDFSECKCKDCKYQEAMSAYKLLWSERPSHIGDQFNVKAQAIERHLSQMIIE